MKALLVDDHALIRDALRSLLRELRPEVTCLEAGDGAGLQAALATHPRIDLVLLDVHLPDVDGLTLLARLRTERPATAVVMLSAATDPSVMQQALALGALGFVPKNETREVLRSALALVLAGGVYVPRQALTPVPATPRAAAPGREGAPTPEGLGLTGRQIDVLAMLMQGKSNKLICRELGLAEPTVKNHVSAILRALGVGGRTEAMARVTQWGWQLPPPA